MKAESSAPAPKRHRAAIRGLLRRPGRSGAGFTLIEAVIGIGLFSLVLLAILIVTGTSWKTQVTAQTDYKAQWVARNLINTIINGDPHDAEAKGLIQACEVVTDPELSALAYRVVWTDEADVEHDDAVYYYLSGQKVYRRVEAYTSPLSIVTGGGTEVADLILAFNLSPNGTIPVEISVTVGQPQGDPVTLQTKMTPRNLTEGE